MHIVSQNMRIIVNSRYVDRYTVAVRDDAVLVSAGCRAGDHVTLGRYKDEAEASDALFSLYAALIDDKPGFNMPDSLLFFGEHIIKDARIKRKGGS